MEESEKQIIRQYRKRRALVALAVLPFVIVIAALGGFFSKRQTQQAAAPIKVTATIPPIADMVRTIGGSRVHVELLLPGGEPPTALPNIYALTDLADAAAIFGVGYGLDDVGLPENAASKFYALDRNINVLLQEGSTGSPYYWLSVKNAQQIVANITDKLIEIDPEERIGYETRRDAYLEQIGIVDNAIAVLLRDVPQTTLAVYGYDWQYFTDDYGLRIVHYQPPLSSEDKTAEAARRDFLAAINDYNLPVIYSDITLSPAPLLPLMDESNVPIINLDIFGGVEDRHAYLQLMSYNARAMFDGLSG